MRSTKLLTVFTGALALTGNVEAAPPAAHLITTTQVQTANWSPSTSTARNDRITPLSAPADLMALAATLGRNRMSAADYTKNVYEYVRNNIDVEFRYGLGKGGRGALVDQSGTPYDQAELMFKLLRANNITVRYEVGTITLTAQQFGQWTGVVSGLNEANQTFTVDAQAACQFLADGGIPATCTPSSGALSSITLAHIWLLANEIRYDPSFKVYRLDNGIDVPTAMGCGTSCGATMSSTAVPGSSTGTTTIDGQSYNYINNVQEANLNNWLTARATALQGQIQTTNRIASVDEVVGWRKLLATPSPTLGASLPYPSNASLTWGDNAEIRDAFRTKLRVRYLIHPWSGDKEFFVDELGGRLLQIAPEFNPSGLGVDGVHVPASACSNCAEAVVVLNVDHPYPVAGYADEQIELPLWTGSQDPNLPPRGSYPVTIVHGLGNASSSTVNHVSGMQERRPMMFSDSWMGQTSYSETRSRNTDQPILAAKLMSQGAAADRIIGGLAKAHIVRHHDVGVVYSHPGAPGSVSLMSVNSAISVNSFTSTAVGRNIAYETTAATWAMLEGAVNQQSNNADAGVSTASLFRWANTNAPTYRFLHLTSSQILTALPSTVADVGYRQQLQAAASAGYDAILNERNTGEILLKSNSRGYTVGAVMKGGTSITRNPVTLLMDSVKVGDRAADRKQYLSVSPADGAARISELDIVTGAGEFPEALPFRRTYNSATAVTEQIIQTRSYTETFEGAGAESLSFSYSYSGPDTAANARLGGGWTHNYNVTASYSGNGMKGLGEDFAIEASAAIAALWSVMDASAAPTFQGRVASVFTTQWLARALALNSVVIDKGGSAESFQQLPDGSFFTTLSNARLRKFGAPTPNMDFTPVTFEYTGPQGDIISFDWALRSSESYPNAGGMTNPKAEPVFKAMNWTFPDGTVVTFHYDGRYLVTSWMNRETTSCNLQTGQCPTIPTIEPYGFVLREVSNNRGRRLIFTTVATNVQVPRQGGYTDVGSSYRITAVTDESGRRVDYDLKDCPPTGSAENNRFACSTLEVRTPDQTLTRYEYEAPDAIAAPNALRPTYRLARWFTPGSTTAYRTLTYDDLRRVRVVTNRAVPANETTYYPGAVAGNERWKRSEVVSPLGYVTTTIFDERNSATSVIDQIGRVTLMSYDNAGRKIRTEYPEHNAEVLTYDVRSNVTQTCRISKQRAGQSCDSAAGDLVTSTTYVEGPTVATCSSYNTCNKPWTETDAKGVVVATHAWGSTGQISSVQGPLVPLGASNVAPQTRFCYETSESISRLIGMVEKVDGTRNRVTRFEYYPNTHLLRSATVDPASSFDLSCAPVTSSAALALKTEFTFDEVGNVFTIDGPRTDVTDLTTYRFDSMRRLTRIEAPLDSITRYTYDRDGLLETTRRALLPLANLTDPVPKDPWPTNLVESQWNTERRTYWPTGDLKSVRDAEGNVTQYAYDADGRQRVARDAEGHDVATVFDAANQVLATWRGGEDWMTGAGEISGTAPNESKAWNPSAYVEGELRYALYGYTPNGKQSFVQDANNNITEYKYDGHDRQLFTLFPHPTTGNRCTVATPITGSSAVTCAAANGVAPSYERSLFDRNNNRESLLTRKGDTIAWTYDNLNRIRTKAAPALPTVTYGYTLLNEPLSLTSPVLGNIPAHSTTYDYDSAGRKSYEENLVGGANRRVSYLYEDGVNRTRTTWPDSYRVQYTYDALNRMRYAHENGATEIAFYDYDSLSRRKLLRFANQPAHRIDYTYEDDDQLDLLTNVLNTTTVTLDHSHDRAGRLKVISTNDSFYLPSPLATDSTPYVPDRLNRYSSVDGNAATYDNNGNLLTWYRNGVLQTYTYDAENKLRTAATDGTTNASITYDYDALGRRISKTVSGATTYYLLDGEEEIAELSGSGAVERRYIMGPAIDDRIARAEGISTTDPAKTYYHVNHQGSVIATAQANGTLAQRFAYDEYGNHGETTGEPFRYTGRRFDPETGLYYYRARYYSPTLGRFLQTDPVGYEDDVNLYAYVRNDPLNLSDPTGKAPPGCGGGDRAACPPPTPPSPLPSAAAQVATVAEKAGDVADVASGGAAAAAQVVDVAGGSAPPSAVAPALTGMTALKAAAEKIDPVADVMTAVQIGAQIADRDVRGATVTAAQEATETAMTLGGGAAFGGVGALFFYGLAQSDIVKGTVGEVAGQAYDDGASAARELAPTPSKLLSLGNPLRRPNDL